MGRKVSIGEVFIHTNTKADEKYGSKKRKTDSGTLSVSAFVEMQDKLQATQRKIEEQNSRKAELDRVMAEQGKQIKKLEMMVSYLRAKDPEFSAFMEAHAPTLTTVHTTPGTTS